MGFPPESWIVVISYASVATQNAWLGRAGPGCWCQDTGLPFREPLARGPVIVANSYPELLEGYQVANRKPARLRVHNL